MVKYFYIMDEGLPCVCDPGGGQDTVASFQSALKYLNKGKHIDACKPEQIEVYPLGVTIEDYVDKTPLKPTDKLPSGTSKQNAIFVHVPRDYQDLTPEERRLYANPPYNPDEKKKEEKPKPMARPAIEKLTISPKKSPKKKPKPKPAAPLDGPGIPSGPPLEPMEPKCWYQLEGDTTPHFMSMPKGDEKGKDLKEHIPAAHKSGPTAKLLDGATPSDLCLFTPWVEPKPGNDLDDGEALPKNTSEKSPMLVTVPRCWYQIEGDPTPHYMPIPKGTEKGKDLKDFIPANLLDGVNPDDLRLFAPGVDPKSGNDVGDGEVLPGTTKASPLLVKKPEPKCWYLVEGDTVPHFMPVPKGNEKGKDLKEHIPATHVSGPTAKLLGGAKPSDLRLFSPGVDPKSGKDLGDGEPLPSNTSEKSPMLVTAPKCWYVIDGDTTPHYMPIPKGNEKGKDLKDYIPGAHVTGPAAKLLEGVKPDGLTLFAPGVDPRSGSPHDDGAILPETSESSPLLVVIDANKYVPNPMDMSLYRCWYQIEGDIVPYYIRITSGSETAKELKEHIFATRTKGRSAKLLKGADCDDLQLYPPGVDEKSGKHLGDDEILPGNTKEGTPILVVVKEVKGQGRKLTPITS